MNTQLTSDQIVFYRENGFLIIDDFLTGTDLSSSKLSMVHFLVMRDNNQMIFCRNGKVDAKFDQKDNFKDTDASVIIGAVPINVD